MKKTFLILLVALAFATLFVGCKDPEVKSYTVTFDVDGNKTTVSAQTVKEGSKATKPTNPEKTGYYLSAWNKADGTKFDFSKDTITADITLTAAWKDAYSIGAVGPAGGWIFYDIDADNANGNADKLTSYEAGWRYIEAAPDAWANGTTTGDSQIAWGPDGTPISGGTETGIGKGKSNTQNIMTQATTGGTEFSAAKACSSYSVTVGSTTYSGWFLPSRDELVALYTNLVNSNSTTQKGTWKTSSGAHYWSSSVENENNAYCIKFDSGSASIILRSSSKYVRPVRYV